MSLFDRILLLEKEISRVKRQICCSSSSSSATRFGVTGEDVLGNEDRVFETNGHRFEVGSNSTNNAWIGIYADGNIDLGLYDNTDNNRYVELWLQNPAKFGIWIGDHSELFIDGIKQDDTTTKLLSLDSNNNTKWVDKATLIPAPTGGSGATTVFLDNTPSSGSVDFSQPLYDSGTYALPNLTAVLDANSEYLFEFSIAIHMNGSSPPINIVFNYDNTPVNALVNYEYLVPDDSAYPSFPKLTATRIKNATWGDNLATAVALGGGWTNVGMQGNVIVRGSFKTGVSATTIGLSIGMMGGGGQWTATAASYLRVEKV